MKKLILGFLLTPILAFATITAEKEFALNRMNGVARKYELGTELAKKRNVVVCKYSAAVQGGANGDVSLLRDLNDSGSTCVIPDNSIIMKTYTDTITAATGGSVGFTAVSSGDLKTAISASAYSGVQAGALDTGVASGMIKLSADKTLKATLTGATISAGVINLYVEYVLGD